MCFISKKNSFGGEQERERKGKRREKRKGKNRRTDRKGGDESVKMDDLVLKGGWEYLGKRRRWRLKVRKVS